MGGWRRVLNIHEQVGDTRLRRGHHRATLVVAEDEWHLQGGEKSICLLFHNKEIFTTS